MTTTTFKRTLFAIKYNDGNPAFSLGNKHKQKSSVKVFIEGLNRLKEYISLIRDHSRYLRLWGLQHKHEDKLATVVSDDRHLYMAMEELLHKAVEQILAILR